MFQIFALAALTAIATAIPAAPPAVQLTDFDDGSVSTPVPTGQFFGTITIQPYSKSSSGYTCASCTISTNAYLYFTPDSMTMNITYNKNSQCSIFAQNYFFYQLQAHSGGAYPNYYVAQVTAENSVIPACLYFTGSHFTVVLDGQGTCPTTSAQAACVNGWQPGTVAQTWVGSFSQSRLPYGSWSGALSIVPYSRSSTGYTCTKCAAITSTTFFHWRDDTLTLNINGGSKGGCTLYAQSYAITQVVDYGAQYPNYYRGYITVEGTSFAICFYWDTLGTIKFMLDDQGTCPQTNSNAACNPGWQPNTVSQVWAGYASPSEQVQLE